MNLLLFLLLAGLLAAVALLVVLRPLRRRGATARSAASRRALTAAVYRDQLAELERDRASGILSDAGYEQAQAELQRRMLEEAQQEPEPATAAPGWRTPVAILVAVPITAALLYLWLGNPAALEATQAAAGAGSPHELAPGEFDAMIAKLAARLEKNPDDVQGWIMLARSYKATRRFAEAERAFARIGPTLEQDPTLLAEYGDLLAVLANGNLEGKPLQMIDKALSLDPDHIMALWLAGTAAFERRDYVLATRHWERLHKLLPPDSEDARAVASGLAEARSKASGGQARTAQAKAAAAASPLSVSGKAALAPALQGKVQAGDTVFIFARAASGVRLPLAVLRARAADLPLAFVLDDSMAINPEMKLSGAGEVRLEALVSRSGNALPQPGDLAGESGMVKPGARNVSIVIDRTVP